MKKTILVSSLVTASFVGYRLLSKKSTRLTGFQFELIQKKLQNSGYTVSKTKDKGVFSVEKNNKKSYLFYDNTLFSQETLFNLLNKYKDNLSSELYILSDTNNTLYAKTKTHFFRWISNEYTVSHPLKVHFSTLQRFKKADEPSWETLQL